MADFFISRAGADRRWAQWIAQELEAAHYTTFLQDWDIRPGHSFPERMEEALNTCARTIVILSQAYLEADYTMSELRAAFTNGPDGRDRHLILIQVGHCEVPRLWRQYVGIDLIDKPLDQVRQLLLEGLKEGRGTREVQFPGNSHDPKVSVAKLPAVNRLLVGREQQLTQLDDAWTNPAIRLVSIVAFGGVGKTSLAINWWHRNRAAEASRILGWSFYMGAAEDRQASADPFLDYALREWFGVTDPPKESWTRGERLAEFVRGERTLLILDGLEPLQFPPGPQMGRLKDPGMIALLKELSAFNPGLCVCTSRLPLTDLEDFSNAGLLSIDLENLTQESGAEYLRLLGVQGAEEELQSASEEVDHHALALTLLGNYVVKRCKGDIRSRDRMPDLFADPKKGGHARRILRQYERLFAGKPELEVLRIMGLFDRPVDGGAVRILRQMSDDAWAGALENLAEARLIEYADLDGPLDCHPLVREHFSQEYRDSNSDAFCEAHARLYEYYSKEAPELPETLEQMTALFHAVYHGCLGRKHLEALKGIYLERMLRTDQFFLQRRLGATGANLATAGNFFVVPWKSLLPGLEDQTWVLKHTGYALRSLGRLSEALDPLETAVRLSPNAWDAATSLSILSRVQLTLGDIAHAMETARRATECADESGHDLERIACRTSLADIFHKAGDAVAAAATFREAESILPEQGFERDRLYALRIFRLYDFLLGQSEFAEVRRRALDTVARHAKEGWLLQTALDHLSLGWANKPASMEAGHHLDLSVQGIRRANALDFLPLGLLGRAAHFRCTGEFHNAKNDLEEIYALAKRCGMRLHLTDCHLEQARLFRTQRRWDEARLHYEAAKRLVAETGYHRRDPEVAELAVTVA